MSNRTLGSFAHDYLLGLRTMLRGVLDVMDGALSTYRERMADAGQALHSRQEARTNFEHGSVIRAEYHGLLEATIIAEVQLRDGSGVGVVTITRVMQQLAREQHQAKMKIGVALTLPDGVEKLLTALEASDKGSEQ